MKTFFMSLKILVTVLSLASCHIGKPIPYNPTPSNVREPITVMKSIIEQQPAAYAYIPTDVEVDEQCIKLYMEGSKPQVMAVVGGKGTAVAVGHGGSSGSLQPVCYKNVGRVGLSKVGDNVWRVEIDDRNGNYMYWVYSYERSDAEQFIDAISNFVKINEVR